MAGEKDFERRFERIERGVRDIEAAADPGLRASAQQLVQSVLELHATCLERLLEIVHNSGAAGQDIIDRLGRDPLVGKLLLLHSLHPLTLEARVVQALEGVQPLLRPHRSEAHLLGIADGVVRVRVTGGNGTKALVERTILDAAPDAASVEIEADDPAIVGFVSLGSLRGP